MSARRLAWWAMAEAGAREISIDSVVAQVASQVHVANNGTTIILSLADNAYFSLDEVGGEIWVALAEPIRVRDICARIRARFEVDEERCAQDTLRLVRELIEAGLAVAR
jgi:hypothetical protein